jgi:hypothetical protein
METWNERRWGATVFKGEEGEEARRLHNWRLEVEDDQIKFGQCVECAVGLTVPTKKYG